MFKNFHCISICFQTTAYMLLMLQLQQTSNLPMFFKNCKKRFICWHWNSCRWNFTNDLTFLFKNCTLKQCLIGTKWIQKFFTTILHFHLNYHISLKLLRPPLAVLSFYCWPISWRKAARTISSLEPASSASLATYIYILYINW